MNLEEMKNFLESFCDSYHDCSDCPYDADPNAWCKTYNTWNIPEYEANKAIAQANFIDNPYWDNITAIAHRQRQKGLRDYGQGLEANPARVIDRILHIEEELVDALMYLEWLKDGIQNGQQ